MINSRKNNFYKLKMLTESFFKVIELETIFWIFGLIILINMNPNTQNTICILKKIGIPCLGCGLGHSIHYLFHGDLARSIQAHPLGSFTVLVLIIRIISLVINCCINYVK